MILVQHERSPSLNLCLQDSIPKFLSGDRPSLPTLLLILLVQGLELGAVDISHTGRLVGAKEGPIAISLDTFHAINGAH
jgi:hypothetical protein